MTRKERAEFSRAAGYEALRLLWSGVPMYSLGEHPGMPTNGYRWARRYPVFGSMVPPSSRSKPGQKNPGAKMSQAQVDALRSARLEGMSIRKLGKAFSISPAQAHRICNGERWK